MLFGIIPTDSEGYLLLALTSSEVALRFMTWPLVMSSPRVLSDYLLGTASFMVNYLYLTLKDR